MGVTSTHPRSRSLAQPHRWCCEFLRNLQLICSFPISSRNHIGGLMPPGKLKLEKSISHVRQVCFLLGKRYHRYPGARSRAGRRSISTLQGFPARSSFLFVCFLNCRRVRVWRGCLSGVGLEVEEGTEKRAGLVELVLNYYTCTLYN